MIDSKGCKQPTTFPVVTRNINMRARYGTCRHVPSGAGSLYILRIDSTVLINIQLGLLLLSLPRSSMHTWCGWPDGVKLLTSGHKVTGVRGGCEEKA